MKLFRKYTLLLFAALMAVAQATAQEDMSLFADVDFRTFFDNTEYTGTSLGPSETVFSASLTPQIGLRWAKNNSLVIGADLFTDFGNDSKFISKARPKLYYNFSSPKVQVYAGIFDINSLKGYYSEIFICDAARYYENRLHGVMGQYCSEKGYAELAIDWCGMYSEFARERFRVLSAGRYNFLDKGLFYGGYAFQMFHYAGSEDISGSVVDNIIVNPYLGTQFSAFFDFDIKLHAILTIQRDRAVEQSAHYPIGGMAELNISKWGVYLGEQIYTGDNLMPYYFAAPNADYASGYGSDLYYGSTRYGTKPYWIKGQDSSHSIFDTRIGYKNSFFNNSVSLNTFISIICEGNKCGTRQVLELSIKLHKDFSKKKLK